MGSHLPPSTPLVSCWYPPVIISKNKIKKVKIPHVPFTYIHPTHTQTHIDAPTCVTVAPDILHMLNPEALSNQKVHSFLVILVTIPYQMQNAPLITLCLYHAHPLAHWCVKHHS